MIKEKTSGEAKVKRQKSQSSPSGIKSRTRVKERGEVFTEPREVKAMCDLCEPDISRIDKKVLEPGCGTGNFLTEILGRRLKKAKTKPHDILVALSNIYGIDIAPDNVVEARTRLRNQIFDHLEGIRSDQDFLIAIDLILRHNIAVGDLLEGRREIYLIDWKPTGEGGFELERWRFSDIEQARASSVTVDNLASMSDAVAQLLEDRPPGRARRPKPKPKLNSLEDLPMFSRRNRK